ncbi:MAG: transglutaminase domain-containing protein [Deltaproteobacteria bacterium]|nr:transglutaminase domain-containing protein [Deltaproteobacteria bacterium]
MTADRGKRWRVVHHVVGALLVFAWIVAAAFQVRSTGPEYGFDAENVPPPATDAAARSYGIYYQDRKIGFSESWREELAGGGARFFDRVYWQFKAQRSVQRLAMESETDVDQRWQLVSFATRIDAGLAKISARAVVRGETLEVELTTAGQTRRESYPLAGPVLVPALLRSYVAARDPAPGSALRLDVYNPLLRGAEPIEVLVEERTADGWRIAEIMRGSIKTTAWIDRSGTTLREESFMGFRMESEPREQAMALPEDAESIPDLVFAAAVPVDGDIDDPQRVRRLVLRLSGTDLSSFAALDGGRQTRRGGDVTVEAPPYPDRAPYLLPLDLAGASAELIEALQPEALVQADDPKIVRLATRVVGAERDPARAAARLSEWVHSRLRKESSVGVPSAVEVLAVMAGDCNEHTVLFTALARAIGVPTRMAAGIVYADPEGSGAAMYYHAWPEVWLGSWVAIDPTFGQLPADATHVRFILGGLERQVDILRLIGTLRVSVRQLERDDGRAARRHPGAATAPAGEEEGP